MSMYRIVATEPFNQTATLKPGMSLKSKMAMA